MRWEDGEVAISGRWVDGVMGDGECGKVGRRVIRELMGGDSGWWVREDGLSKMHQGGAPGVRRWGGAKPRPSRVLLSVVSVVWVVVLVRQRMGLCGTVVFCTHELSVAPNAMRKPICAHHGSHARRCAHGILTHDECE